MSKRLPVLITTLADAKRIAGTLGQVGKMPGYSYGLSAQLCRRGARLRQVPGSVCESCYARTGWYETWHLLHVGHQRRLDGVGHPQWVDAMVFLLSHYCQPPHDYFRWHDSGDLQSLDHLRNLVQVCRRTPSVKHWLPTHEIGMVSQYLRSEGVFPDNLVVRISADMVDRPAKLPPALTRLTTSTVQSWPTGTGKKLVLGKGSVECRALELRDNRCGACRACWDPRVRNVSYPKH